MRASTAVRCWADDCYEEVGYLIKLHKHDEPLLSLAQMAACRDHISLTFREALELMDEDASCYGMSVVLP